MRWMCFLLLAIPAVGRCQSDEIAKAVLKCSAIDNIEDRLDCYDSLARALPKAAAAAVPETPPEPVPGKWQLQVAKDLIDDSTAVSIGTYGNTRQVLMVLRCRQAKIDVILSWNGRFLGATPPVVWTRVGVAKAAKLRWVLTTDHKAVMLQQNAKAREAKALVRELLAGDRLVVQTDHFARGRIEDVIDLRELRNSVGPLKQECSLE